MYKTSPLLLRCFPPQFVFLHCIAFFWTSCWIALSSDRGNINRIYVHIAFSYILIWTSRSNKNLPGIHRPNRLREICLRPQQQREGIRHPPVPPHCPQMTVMIPLLLVAVGRDLQWLRSLHNYLPCGRRICKEQYPRTTVLV